MEKTYTISEAAKALGKSPSTLRRWEAKGYIKPNYTPSGQREYTAEDLQSLRITK